MSVAMEEGDAVRQVTTAKYHLSLPSYLHELLPSTFFTVSLRVLYNSSQQAEQEKTEKNQTGAKER